MAARPQRVCFPGSHGATLAARIDRPAGPIRAWALFAHCFTCSKDSAAARRIAEGLASRGIAVLRFDFTGLGSSDGEFASTNFSSNIGDIVRAADFLRDRGHAPQLLIGHSLGGAAVLVAAAAIVEVRAVATIGAPADADHVVANFAASLDAIKQEGEAQVVLAGRQFTIREQFLEDLAGHSLTDAVAASRKALLVMHAPFDAVVGIDNASAIFAAAHHPKSFVSLDNADHLLSAPADAAYAAGIIAAWAARFVDADVNPADAAGDGTVVVAETGEGTFQNSVAVGGHRLLADEPESVGGLGSGPTPYDFLGIALGACTSMTLRMYADRKQLPVDRITVAVSHDKIHAADCEACSQERRDQGGRLDRFERIVTIEGELDPQARARMLQIADMCPVHRTLEEGAAIVTRAADPD